MARIHLNVSEYYHFDAGLGARYGPLIPHLLSASVHRTVVNALQDKMNSETFPHRQQ